MSTDVIGGFPYAHPNCNGCGRHTTPSAIPIAISTARRIRRKDRTRRSSPDAQERARLFQIDSGDTLRSRRGRLPLGGRRRDVKQCP